MVTIIPDVHGRTFWKQVINDIKDGESPIIFLGDYLDPYEDEMIDFKDAISNFNDIIEFKKENRDRVTLLLGNHDIHYIDDSPDCRSSRYTSWAAEEVKQLICKNIDLFQLILKTEVNNKKFVFSHAGIRSGWLMQYKDELKVGNYKTAAEMLNNLGINELLKDPAYRTSIFDTLSAIPYSRGGISRYGSIVWENVPAYIHETPIDGTIQIFGHTQLVENPVNIHNYYYDLDVRRGFMINDNGDVCELDGSVIPQTSLK